MTDLYQTNISILSRSLCCGSKEPVYQAIWADNSDFQEVLVSPTMVNDHMPDNVMEALQKVGFGIEIQCTMLMVAQKPVVCCVLFKESCYNIPNKKET